MPYWEPSLYKITDKCYKVQWKELNNQVNSRIFDYEINLKYNLRMAVEYLKYLRSHKPKNC